MRRKKAFTLIELMVVVSIIALLLTILVPTLGRVREIANQTHAGTQVKGIYNGLFGFSQDNGPLQYYPGLLADGTALPGTGDSDTDPPGVPWTDSAGDTVEGRVAVLLENGMPSEIFISRAESLAGVTAFDKSTLTTVSGDDGLTNDNYSYSLLELTPNSGRFREWRSNINAEAPIISDRCVGGPGYSATDPDTYSSLHSADGWTGNVGYNDGHVDFRQNPLMNTNYNENAVSNDNLFVNEAQAAGTNPVAESNAVMITNANAVGNILHDSDPAGSP